MIPVDERILLPMMAPEILPREAPLLVTATLEDGMVKACSIAGSGHFNGELEYAFYLLVGGERTSVHWYTGNPNVSLPVPDDAVGQQLEVRAFVRERASPDKKFARTVAVIRTG